MSSATPTEPTEPAPGEPFRRLLAACIEAVGEHGSAALEPLLANHPEHAAALRERIDKLVRAGLLSAEPEPRPDLPERLGDFRLIRRLGAGGMGVVYLAEQVSLGRQVALKLVRPEQRFFPGARERFQREVAVIAKLGDPGIVPIYAVGEAEGIHFFTMEHVRGATLTEVLAAVHDRHPADLVGNDLATAAAARAGLPVPVPLPELFAGTWIQACCRVVARMARAAQHAHERGIVHRDLKPSNAMVTPDGRVLLLDFGLAAAEGTLRITRTGAQLGTLHYMAPEQLLDGTVDARTDVYALGATLHELLALEPPFHADSSEGLRRAILAGAPRSLANRGAQVPRDVETICRRALAREAPHRYATALALAEDLERFLGHRPILARPAGPWLRLRRWARRRPTVATALATVLLVAAVVPFAMQAARADAEAAARHNLHSATAAIERMLGQVRDPALQNAPGLDRVRLQQLDAAERLLGDLFRQNPSDRTVRALFVRGSIHAAQVRLACGLPDRVLADLAVTAPALAQLRETAPDDDSLFIDHCALLLTRGSANASLGQLPEAVRDWRQLTEECAQRGTLGASPRVAQTLATAHNNLSRVLAANGDRRGALQELELALALEPDEGAAPGSGAAAIVDRARMQVNLAGLLRDDGQPDAADREYRQLQAALEAARTKFPDEPDLKLELARVRYARSELRMRTGHGEGTAAERNLALDALRELVAAYPDRTAYLRDLGAMLFSASCASQLQGDLSTARTLAEESIACHERLLGKVPGAAEVRTELSTFRRQLAGLHLAAGETTAGVALLERAITEQAEVADSRPADPHYRMDLAALQQELGIYHYRNEAWPAARDAWRAAAHSYERVLAAGSKAPLGPRRLPMVLQVLAQAELMCDDLVGVVDALRRLQAAAPLPAATLREAGMALHVDDRADFQALVAATEAMDQATAAGGEAASNPSTEGVSGQQRAPGQRAPDRGQ